MKKGSITIFLALLLTCFFSAVFAFLEAARVCGLKANAQISTLQARDTVLASYNRDVWENYHLMFWEAEEGDLPELDGFEALQQSAIEGNLTAADAVQDNYYMLQVHLSEVTTTAYQLASDDGGNAFREQAAQMMKQNLGETAAQAMMAWITGEDESAQTDLEEEALEALEALESAAAGDAQTEGGTASPDAGTSGGSADDGGVSSSGAEAALPEVKMTENPLEWVKKMRKNGILAIVLPEESISQKSIELSGCVGNRTLESGSLTVSESETVTDKLLFYLYLDQYFLDASKDSGDHALDYELEYMIAGKAGDQENLKAVVRRLLLLREAANLVYLETNAEKQREAAAIATVLVSMVGQPELEPLVQQGLLAAWAYAESISDVRILLEGGKVSLVKTADQWHTELGSLSSSVYAAEGSSQTKGLSYANYLQILMWTTSEQKLTQRAMDMVEKNTGTAMDQMVCRAVCKYEYEAYPLFWNLVTLGQNSFGTLHFTDESGIYFLE
ncbi:MAG: DUF5702 domain-containing protein [Clostridiales bacterium]|nr:DUF5702 domain-containing protein [Clostridiales bacterium]